MTRAPGGYIYTLHFDRFMLDLDGLPCSGPTASSMYLIMIKSWTHKY